MNAPSDKKVLTPELVEEYYNHLKNWNEPVRQPSPEVPKRWSTSDFQTLSGYAVRVAKGSTLPEFDHFLRTGELAHPIKMSPAEMELLQGGSPTTEWIGAIGAWGAGAVVAAGAAACASD